MRKVDDTTYEPVEQTGVVQKSRLKMFLQGAVVFVVMFVVLYWFLSRATN